MARGAPRSTQDVRSYLRGKLGSARDLIRALNQRKETLGRVVRAIVDRQAEFLERGVPGIRPMKMQDVADAIGVHLSTVSRAIAHKHLQTDLGVFPLRSLFDGGKAIGGANDSGGEARNSLKERIRRIFLQEDGANPLSDEEVVKLLEEMDLHIARRTVAKYRRDSGFPRNGGGSSTDVRAGSVKQTSQTGLYPARQETQSQWIRVVASPIPAWAKKRVVLRFPPAAHPLG